MDPEQIYQEVLQEEQAKGSASAVAEGRAKAARQRAHEGSPHPKEAKWWPGAQPQFEEGGAAPAAAEAEPEPAEAAPEPAPEPAAEPAAEVVDVPAHTAETTPPPEPAQTPPASQPEQVPATAAAVTAPSAEATEIPPEQRPAGVSYGVPTGNRLRPEDAVGSEAQFAGQQAMYERRKLIDELVATGVPEVSAADAGTRGSPVLALLYLIIPLLAIGLLVANDDGAAAGGDHGESTQEGDSGSAITVVAQGVAFDTETLRLPAEEDVEIEFDNQDSTAHNIAIYESESAEDMIFDGPDIQGGSSTTYEFTAPPAGEYYFQCDLHPDMNGNVVVE